MPIIKTLLCVIVIHSHLAYAEKLAVANSAMVHDDNAAACNLFPDDTGFLYSHIAIMFIGFWILTPMGNIFGLRSDFTCVSNI